MASSACNHTGWWWGCLSHTGVGLLGLRRARQPICSGPGAAKRVALWGCVCVVAEAPQLSAAPEMLPGPLETRALSGGLRTAF